MCYTRRGIFPLGSTYLYCGRAAYLRYCWCAYMHNTRLRRRRGQLSVCLLYGCWNGAAYLGIHQAWCVGGSLYTNTGRLFGYRSMPNGTWSTRADRRNHSDLRLSNSRGLILTYRTYLRLNFWKLLQRCQTGNMVRRRFNALDDKFTGK